MQNSDHINILIVDDNPYNRQLIITAAEAVGYTSLEAESGVEALEFIKKHTFDLIFMDLLMPKLDGFETSRSIRQQNIQTPIIAVSAISLKQDQKRSLEAGCNSFMPKPLNFKELKSIIQKTIENGKNQQKTAFNEHMVLPLPSKKKMSGTILLIEENLELQIQLASFLKSLGFYVSSVRCGNDAIQLIKQKRTDIVISNLFNSDLDGIGLLKIIKRSYPEILFFIHAPLFDPDTFQFAMQLGVDGIVPVSQFESTILRIIESAIYEAGRNGSLIQNASTAKQVSHAQSKLIQFGCNSNCNFYDLAFTPLHSAGGDMARCRCFNLAGRCGFVLADVAGHNVMASYISATFLGILMSNWDYHQDPLELIQIMNNEILKLGYETSHICVTVVLWDQRRRKIDIVTAGNPGPLLVSNFADKKTVFKNLAGGGIPIGIFKGYNKFSRHSLFFQPGDRLFLFTDGIEEKEIVHTYKELKPSDQCRTRGLCQTIMDSILSRRQQEDDMILISLTALREVPDPHYNYSIPSTYTFVDNACEWISIRIIPDFIPKGHDHDFIMLAIREAILNGVEHGNKNNPEAYVDIFFDFKDGTLTFTVSDEGSGFDLEEKMSALEKLNGYQMGQRGLSLICNTSDSVKVYGGSIVISFKEKAKHIANTPKIPFLKINGDNHENKRRKP